MKKFLLLSLLFVGITSVLAQYADVNEFDEAGLIEKITDQAKSAGYTVLYRAPSDTNRVLTAEPGKAYRLALVFREQVDAPGRRLVVYQKDKEGRVKKLYMARKDQHMRKYNGHVIITDVPAFEAGDHDIYMWIDALPKEGKLFIFSK